MFGPDQVDSDLDSNRLTLCYLLKKLILKKSYRTTTALKNTCTGMLIVKSMLGSSVTLVLSGENSSKNT